MTSTATRPSRRERAKQAVEAIYAEAKTIQSSDDFKAYLDFHRSMTGRYSVNNTLWLASQARMRGLQISTVLPVKGKPVLDEDGNPVRDEHGVRQVETDPNGRKKLGWNALGRRIKKGEKALYVLRPQTGKRRGEDGEVELDDEGREQTYTYFVPAAVFDVSQTEGEPLPDFGMPGPLGPEVATEEQVAGLRSALEQVITEQHGFELTYEPLPSGMYGYVSSRGDVRRMVIDSNLDPADQLTTLCHEEGHVRLGHVGEDVDPQLRHRGTQEREAEGYAYLVAQEMGVDSAEFSSFYVAGHVAGWTNESPESFINSVDRVTDHFTDLMKIPEIEAAVAEVRPHRPDLPARSEAAQESTERQYQEKYSEVRTEIDLDPAAPSEPLPEAVSAPPAPQVEEDLEMGL